MSRYEWTKLEFKVMLIDQGYLSNENGTLTLLIGQLCKYVHSLKMPFHKTHDES